MSKSRSVWETLNRPAWWIIGLILLLVVTTFYFGLMRPPGALMRLLTVEPAVTPTAKPLAEIEITPIVGGATAPTATPAAALTASAATTDSSEGNAENVENVDEAVVDSPDAVSEPTAEPTDLLQVGQRVTLLPGQSLTLYADASATATPLVTYNAAPLDLVVIEPSGDYAGYPVENEGQQWYRLRDENGLVGWVSTATIARSNQPSANLRIAEQTDPLDETSILTVDADAVVTVERGLTETTLIITGSGPITGPQAIERVLLTATPAP